MKKYYITSAWLLSPRNSRHFSGGKAAGVFQRFWNIWSYVIHLLVITGNSSTTAIKPHLDMSVVVTTAPFACETWTASIPNTLDVFHRQCLRNILTISWWERIDNEGTNDWQEKEAGRTCTILMRRQDGSLVTGEDGRDLSPKAPLYMGRSTSKSVILYIQIWSSGPKGDQ